MSVHAGYDDIGKACTTGPQVGTVHLKQAMLERWQTTSDGIFNCRNQHNGSGKLSAHGEGRAVDLHWIYEKSGREIASTLVQLNASLGIQCIIWWNQVWSYEKPYWHAYHGDDAHRTHLHVEQNWSGAKELTLQAARIALAVPPPLPPNPLRPIKEDHMFIVNPTGDQGTPGEFNYYLVIPGGTYRLMGPQELEEGRDAKIPEYEMKPHIWYLLSQSMTEIPR